MALSSFSLSRVAWGALLAALAVVVSGVLLLRLPGYRIRSACAGLLALEGTPPKTREEPWSALDTLVFQAEVFRSGAEAELSRGPVTQERCERDLSALARAGKSVLGCGSRCSTRETRVVAADCTSDCMRADGVLLAARRDAQKRREASEREWLAHASRLGAKRVAYEARGFCPDEQRRRYDIALPDGAAPDADGVWRFAPRKAFASLRVQLESNDERSLERSATAGEKAALMREVRSGLANGRYVLARIGPDWIFSSNWLLATTRDVLRVQVLWNLDDRVRVECAAFFNLLDMDDALVQEAIAWTEQTCASVSFRDP